MSQQEARLCSEAVGRALKTMSEKPWENNNRSAEKTSTKATHLKRHPERVSKAKKMSLQQSKSAKHPVRTKQSKRDKRESSKKKQKAKIPVD
jgi:hypothetical protein